MSRCRNRLLVGMALAVLVSVVASAQPPAGPVGDVGRAHSVLVATPMDSSGGGPTCGTCQCFPWKIGDRDQAGTTWVSSSDSYLYSGAEHFHPANTAPGDLTPGPDLAGIIGVGFATPNFIPRRIDVYYSFFPVNRAWDGGNENGPDPGPVSTPAPAQFGLTWFNGYGPGSTLPSAEATITTYPTSGVISYGPFFVSLFNINTRYNVYVKTGKFGNNGNGNGNNAGPGANQNSFALAGVICFSR
ncbi:MAG TPA: hypothetical protein VLC46_15330 [Thermoanaerobaculia bacterium]|jgi:hypothetical protein|nr:hypothetical protein [Thermoanaerobaculia bacterium]